MRGDGDGAAAENPTIKPCPFCGSFRVRLGHIRDGSTVGCMDCGGRGPNQFHGRADQPSASDRAVEAWNRRAPTPLPERREG